MKKLWKKPELVVLYKGRPEESVLVNCKTETGEDGANFTSGFFKCYTDDYTPCGPTCQTAVSS